MYTWMVRTSRFHQKPRPRLSGWNGDFATVWCYSSFWRPFPIVVTAANRSFLKAFLHGLAWVFLAIAGVAFWVGGRAISEFGKIDRILSEMLGLGIAAGTGMLGYILKTTADDLGGEKDSLD